MSKEKLARQFVNWTDGWNHAFHAAIEAKVMAEYRNLFPNGAQDPAKTIADMRSFYYSRMTNTAALVIGIIGAVVAAVSLLVALVALVK